MSNALWKEIKAKLANRMANIAFYLYIKPCGWVKNYFDYNEEGKYYADLGNVSYIVVFHVLLKQLKTIITITEKEENNRTDLKANNPELWDGVSDTSLGLWEMKLFLVVHGSFPFLTQTTKTNMNCYSEGELLIN